MARIAYIDRAFSPKSIEMIEQANAICEDYAVQGFTLTLRQLYYQFVSRDLIANRQSEYKRLGSVINDARLAGLIDWDHMEDRTRNIRALSHWETPGDVIDAAARGYRIDKWNRQAYHVEVWIEKDALVGVIDGVCTRNDVAYFSCRGYTSQSEIWSASQRLIRATTRRNAGKQSIIIHLGDHDPSGIDMTRDIRDRLTLFCEHHDAPAPIIERIALNMDQVNEYDPPPNPAKITDSRSTGYIDSYGEESWELDALAPNVIDELIQSEIDNYRDEAIWERDRSREDSERALLNRASDRWNEVAALLSKPNE